MTDRSAPPPDAATVAGAPAEAFGPDPRDLPLKLWLARLAHGISPAAVTLAYADWWSHLLTSPSRRADLANSALRHALRWTQYAGEAWQGACPPCVAPAPNDKRFSAHEWREAPFNLASQAFLLNQQWWQEAMTGVHGVSEHHEEVVSFITRQWLDMWSPSNFVAGNPQVLKETLARAGGNLVEGGQNWWRDAVAVLTDGPPRGVEAFRPGKGVALTPGKVVFRNELIELIQYEPATPEVGVEPVLIIPSWIMKFYILDLTPDDSLVKYLVGEGHTVFMVSWRNPDGAQRDLGLNDYLTLGALAAIDAVRRARPRAKIHAAGYCLGGTLLAMAAALLGAAPDNPLKTVSLLAAQTDFHEPGELGLFIDESQIAFLESVMAERGYLDGRQMAGVHNDLAEGRYLVRGEPVRLDRIKVPAFIVATERDHVSPWRSVYKMHEFAHGPVTFVLSSGGHNVGIVNPVGGPLAHPQASYRVSTHAAGKAPASPGQWLDEAAPQPGSWWACWSAWLASHRSGTTRAGAMVPLQHGGAAIEAPGDYVHVR